MSGPVATVVQSDGQTTSGWGPLREPQRYERIAERLVADIRTGRLAPGTRLPAERELARRLGVGRASVREAIAALQVRGVLETRPGSGSFVAADARQRVGEDADADTAAPAPDASPSDLLEARLALEPGVARLAARSARADPVLEALLAAMDAAGRARDLAAWNDADRRFHHRLAALTGNPILLLLADHVAALMDQPLWQALRDESIAGPGRVELHAAEHRLIVAAVADGDPDAAAYHAARHLERVRRHMTLDLE